MRINTFKILSVWAVLGLSIAGSVFVPNSSAFARSESIAVVVNDGAISSSDVSDRMTLIIRSSRLQDTAEMRDKVRPQVMSGLIEEELRLQEAERLNIEVTQDEIDQGFARIAQQNNFEADQFRQVLESGGINIKTMYRQIRSQIAWGKVVQEKIRPQINVSGSDVAAARERLRGNIGKTEYRAAEIFLPIENPQEAGNVQQLANRLTSQIKSGKAPFPKVAQQFSKSAGAAKGGDLGWIQEGQTDAQIEQALSRMESQTLSNPVKTVAGYHILLLLAKRQVSEETMPSDEDLTNQIGTERLERMQRKYLLDLKANAFIENRV